MANLYLMCGCPGAGKSTFIEENFNQAVSVISRDTIRFSLVSPDEDYFSREDEVTKEFWKQINDNLAKGKHVVADQTSLTPRSRKWFIQHVTGYAKLNIVLIDEDLETCLERNEKRKGTRAYVPEENVRRMYKRLIEPSFKEGFDNIFKYNSKEGLRMVVDFGQK